MFKKTTLLMALSLYSTYALETHIRAGVDLNILKLDLNNLSKMDVSTPYPLPQLTTEVRTSIDPYLDFGISGTYMPIVFTQHRYHALKVGMYSYFKSNWQNSIGLGLQIHHIPLSPIEPSVIGYLNNVSVGISMQGTLLDNLYAHFEINQDITPYGYQSWETYTGDSNYMYVVAPALVSFKHFTSSISLGYIIPTDR